jgi:hypothetical protein
VATDLTPPDSEPTAETIASPAPLVAPRVATGRTHRGRFAVLYGILGVVVVAGIVGISVYAGRAIHPAPTWSAWKPSGGGVGAAKEIAARVATGYRLPSGEQMVDVIAKEPSVSPTNQQIPIHYIAVRGKKGAGDTVAPISSSDSMMYSLCGLGASCSITKGKASVERGTLVRREILELALYTFKYVSGVKHVIAFMPPPPGSQPKYVVYLQKSDLAAQLKHPLALTLNKKVPLPSAITPKEQQTIDAVTQAKVYSFSLSQAQQGDAILVLAPLAA